MAPLTLSFAASEYDHFHDLVSGEVRAEGIALNYLKLSIEEVFFRFTRFREWDLSEMSMGKYSSLKSQGDDSLTAIPVFPSRVFRQSSLYVRADSPLEGARELAGKRVGIPEWAQTASIYTRGWIAHQVGVPLTAIEWVQAGVNQPGRVEKVALRLPDGISYRPEPGPQPQRHAAGRRHRRGDDRPPARRRRGRQRRGRPALSQLSRDRGGVLPGDRDLPDHARDRAQGRRVRGESLDRDEPADGLRRGQAERDAPRPGNHRDALSLRLVLRCRGRGPRVVRRGLLPLRDRAQPDDAGGVSAIRLRAGRLPQQESRPRTCSRPRSRRSSRSEDCGAPRRGARFRTTARAGRHQWSPRFRLPSRAAITTGSRPSRTAGSRSRAAR